MRIRILKHDKMKPKTFRTFAILVVIWALADSAVPRNLDLFAGHAASASAEQSEQANRKNRGLSPESRSHIRQAMSAVGLILVRNDTDPAEKGPRPRGSAVVVRQDGIIATNFHVIARDKSPELYDEIYLSLPVDGVVMPSASRLHRLKTVLINKELDLAMLKIADDGPVASGQSPIALPTIEMGDSRAVQELDDLVIIGYPEKGGFSVTVSPGTIEGKDILENWIKTDARLIHGNSGGAAVNGEGKLIGIPTKVVVDKQPTDKDGDGFPDGFYTLGAVGFLRPAHIIAAMLAQVSDIEMKTHKGQIADPRMAMALPQLAVSGVVKSALDGKPIAGAAVGLTPLGTQEASAKNILTWGYTDADGQFRLNKLVPPGRYTLQAKTFGYEIVRRDIELSRENTQLRIELRRSE